jgi:hypothetical protein
MRWFISMLKSFFNKFRKHVEEKERRKPKRFIVKEDPYHEFKRKNRDLLGSLYYPDGGFGKEYIVLHHSFTKDNETVDWNAIWKFHRSWRCNGFIVTEMEANKLKKKGLHVTPPWRSIGYHFGCERVGNEYQVRVGRDLLKAGAHCRDGGFNSKSIGICVVGNWDEQEPPAEQIILTRLLVEKLMMRYSIKRENVIGHREAQAMAGVPNEMRKSCPGHEFNLISFRAGLLGGSFD